MNPSNKETKLMARISKSEKKIIKEKAKANGMKLSEFIRYATLAINTIDVKITTEVKAK